MNTPTTPSERIRLTISVSPEVHATFQRMADASGMSLSRAMGDWLEDTLDAASYTATLMEKARAAPKQVMREVHAYALGLADETGTLMESLRKKGAAEDAAASVSAQRLRQPLPPSSNTGGKGRPEGGLSFPKTCAVCGARWSINHKCKPGKKP